MTTFKTNAKTLPHLDIALLEVERLIDPAEWPRSPAVYYNRESTIACDCGSVDSERILERSAFIECSEDSPPSRWSDLRTWKPAELQDHSTHNLYPFEGKLQPQLARALINICMGVKRDGRVGDPFCGSGTVLVEASLMGFSPSGCDVEPFAAYLSRVKTTTNDGEFDQELTRLVSDPLKQAALRKARQSAKPWKATLVLNYAAQYFLQARSLEFDAIVTSPPYFNAIDYKDRHEPLRERLALDHPEAPETIGVGQSVVEYHKSVGVVSAAIATSLRSGGMLALVAADHQSVPSSVWYELALKSAGLEMFAKLRRPYREVKMGIAEDVILILRKP